MTDFSLKSQAISLAKGIGLVILLITAMRVFNLGMVGTMLLLIGVQVVMNLYKWFKQGTFNWRNLLKSIALIIVLVPLIRFMYRFGVWGFVASIALISGIILWRKWPQYMEVKHHIETLIWGAPLKDLEHVPKVKIVR